MITRKLEIGLFSSYFWRRIQPGLNRLEIFLWKGIVAFLHGKPGGIRTAWVLVIGVSLVFVPVGFAIVRWHQQTVAVESLNPGSLPQVLPSSPIYNTGQHNLLLILVDRLDQPSPFLEGVWLVVNGNLMNGSKLMPVAVIYDPEDADQTQVFPGSDPMVSNGTPTQYFLDELTSRGLWWDYYVVVDRTGREGLARWIGWLNLDNPELVPDKIGSPMNAASGDALNAVYQQAAYLRALCARSEEINQKLDPEIVLSLLDGHFRTDYDLTRFSESWYSFRDRGFAWYCEFPTLEEGRSISYNQ